MKKVVTTLSLVACLTGMVAVSSVMVGCAGDASHKSTGEVLDDGAITTKVKTALLTNSGTKGVKVKVYRGDVQLSGFVDTAADRDRALELARDVKGVQNVKNDVLVK